MKVFKILDSNMYHIGHFENITMGMVLLWNNMYSLQLFWFFFGGIYAAKTAFRASPYRTMASSI